MYEYLTELAFCIYSCIISPDLVIRPLVPRMSEECTELGFRPSMLMTGMTTRTTIQDLKLQVRVLEAPAANAQGEESAEVSVEMAIFTRPFEPVTPPRQEAVAI